MTQNTLPAYHFLLIDPELGAEWFFDAARLYWETFQPTVVSDLAFVALIRPTFTVTVTVVARRERSTAFGVQLAQIRPDILFDPVAQDDLASMRAELNRRAQTNQPFGMPLLPTLPAGGIVQPTLGPLTTRAPSGFVTQTPTPTPGPTTDPNPPPGTPAPIDPTPGALDLG